VLLWDADRVWRTLRASRVCLHHKVRRLVLFVVRLWTRNGNESKATTEWDAYYISEIVRYMLVLVACIERLDYSA
jgi:hypothetical protein